ncbi:MAG: host-nuclease inhibitor Gam family protein [Ignavibacteriae bacterium]|nr:host-nuclease inhibitor Gam family protein [Ignavibacteriota bacterium]
METEINFMDELLAEVEIKEELQSEAYFDLLIKKISGLESQISRNFKIAEEEVKIINDFYLKKNSKIKEAVDGIARILEEYIREKNRLDPNVKTISFPNGILKLHKKPDRIEISDLDLFLKSATNDMLTVVPESIKPNLTKIKALMKYSGRSIPGISKIAGTEEFKLTLNNNKEEEDDKTNEA